MPGFGGFEAFGFILLAAAVWTLWCKDCTAGLCIHGREPRALTRIEIKDIAPPRDLVDSMARQMKAEREKRAQILESEGLRQAAILKAEGAKQAVVLEAEGRREAAYRDAEARERSAEAEAKATQMVSDAISKGNVQAINYFVANNYMKVLEFAGEGTEPEGHYDAARSVVRHRLARRAGADRGRGIQWRWVGFEAADATRAAASWFRPTCLMNLARKANTRDLEIRPQCSRSM